MRHKSKSSSVRTEPGRTCEGGRETLLVNSRRAGLQGCVSFSCTAKSSRHTLRSRCICVCTHMPSHSRCLCVWHTCKCHRQAHRHTHHQRMFSKKVHLRPKFTAVITHRIHGLGAEFVPSRCSQWARHIDVSVNSGQSGIRPHYSPV